MVKRNIFLDETNPLIPSRRAYEKVEGVYEGAKKGRIKIEVKDYGLKEPEIPEELREEYENKLLKERSEKDVSENPEVLEYYSEFFKGKGKTYTPKEGGWHDDPMWRITGVNYENGGEILLANGRVLYTSFAVVQKGEGSLREKITSDPNSTEAWGLANPYGVSPAIVLTSEDKIYTLFGERGKNVGLAAGALGIIGGGMGSAKYILPRHLTFQEIGEEVPKGIIDLDSLILNGETYAGKNPHSWHLETLQLARARLVGGYEGKIEEVKGGVYLIRPKAESVEGEPEEHSRIYLVEIHPDKTKLLKEIAEGNGIVEGHTYSWAEPHKLAYMVSVESALEKYF